MYSDKLSGYLLETHPKHIDVAIMPQKVIEEYSSHAFKRQVLNDMKNLVAQIRLASVTNATKVKPLAETLLDLAHSVNNKNLAR